MDAEALYRQLGRLIEAAPDFAGYGPLNNDQLMWISRAYALVDASSDPSLKVDFSFHQISLRGPTRADAIQAIMFIVHKALALAELQAPAAARGAFIPVGNTFDAFAALTKVFQAAQSDLFVVDPYMDEAVLTDFGGTVPKGVKLRLMSDQATAKASLTPAAQAWAAQHGSIEVRLAPARALHDRAIFVDQTTAWILTQSIKDFAKRSPAEIVRADDTAGLKIAAYESVWSSASVIV